MSSFIPSSILIVGEDSHFCSLIQSYVRRSANQAVFAHLAEIALELAQQEPPAAIVLDADLPDKGSWKLLRALKANPFTRAIPVMLCCWLDEGTSVKREGANVCLRMPILYGNFIEALHAVGVAVESEISNP